MLISWTKTRRLLMVSVVVSGLSGCASSLDKVTDEEAPTMEEVYDRFTGVNGELIAQRKAALLASPARVVCGPQLGYPPYPEQLAHLYPRLPNPDLFMYVRPHAVGASGSPIPAYITRFSMYERQPYALPGETLDTLEQIEGHVPSCHSTQSRLVPAITGEE